ncbi:hypothetical protein KP509_14G059400 [Ceratopteris richardii]|uniref:phytol kinase n=1 Tax=Ceratopteris richardii TaxID=49495 RepID=A0A8T2TA90_CERRI|nr:hypothetical protein KP509_14G059400 [Ceratopteris richardii]
MASVPNTVYKHLHHLCTSEDSRPNSLQRLATRSSLSYKARIVAAPCKWCSGGPQQRSHVHICSSLPPGIGQDILYTGAGFAGAYAWVRIFDILGEMGLLEQNLSRKLIHVSTGLLYVLIWPFFSPTPWSRLFAISIPVANAIRLAVNGFGIFKDEGFVKSISRGGTSGELLRGPLYYALALTCCTVCFWRDSPVGMTAIAIMCGGDGVADIIGRHFGTVKLPYNSSKSWAGSMSMFGVGCVLSLSLVKYFSTLGFYSVDWTHAAWSITFISLLATVVESLPISNFLDDNISVPLVSIIMGMVLFSDLL